MLHRLIVETLFCMNACRAPGYDVASFNCEMLFCMNACRAPRLQISPKRFVVATVALFSVSEQNHCALVVYDSDCSFVMTDKN